VLQYIADLAPESGLAPAYGTSGRYLVQNSLNYLASELHACYGPLFGPGSDEFKTAQKAKVATKYAFVEKSLPQAQKDAPIDIASLYLYVIQSWSGYVGVDLAAFPGVQAFAARVAAHPTVVAAHAEMNAAA
jgi:glutathione S-transferase